MKDAVGAEYVHFGVEAPQLVTHSDNDMVYDKLLSTQVCFILPPRRFLTMP
jgi:hypothetical protein